VNKNTKNNKGKPVRIRRISYWKNVVAHAIEWAIASASADFNITSTSDSYKAIAYLKEMYSMQYTSTRSRNVYGDCIGKEANKKYNIRVDHYRYYDKKKYFLFKLKYGAQFVETKWYVKKHEQRNTL